jgi:hypothetical protein
MSVVGSAGDWVDLLERMLPDLLRLILASWQALPGPLTDDSEDEITKLLCRALCRNRTVRELPFYVQFQMVELDPAPEQALGRLDIAFLPTGVAGPPSEAIYFCLECKRLNVVSNGPRRPGGSDYVLHGMLRFVRGQYARAVRHGGMLGYVLDEDIAGAIANVESNVQSHWAALRMDAPGVMRSSSVLADEEWARETLHHRAHEPARFRIHHLFVAARADDLVAIAVRRHGRATN